MVALANKDFIKAVAETKKVTKYFKDESLSLLLKSETLKIEKKYDKLNDVYEAIGDALQFARESPYPDEADLFTDLFADPIPLR